MKFANFTSKLVKGIFLLLRMIVIVLILDPAIAGPVSQQATQIFSIPAQPLDGAIHAFIQTTDWQVGFVTDDIKGIESKAVRGEYSKEQALEKLLEGTGIQYRFIESNSITLQKSSIGGLTTEMLLAQVPQEDVPRSEISDESDTGPVEQEDLTVSGQEMSGYNVLDASTATKTDTPIFDTPVSIQVVPRVVMQDQQAIRLHDVTKNVSGVLQTSGFGDFYDQFLIRGFDSGNEIVRFRNGARVPNMTFEMANIERVEVLKGPASILYGRIEPGGIINAVTHKPLSTPYYALQQQFGSYDFYRTALDATGPITKDGSLLYRLDFAYQNSDSFRDFMGKERIFVAPSLTWRPMDALELNLNVEYRDDETVFDPGIPVVDGRIPDVPRSRTFVVPGSTETFTGPLVEFNWSYRFNEQWNVRNGVTATFVDNNYVETFPLGVADDDSLPLFLAAGDSIRDNYTVYFDLNGEFETFGFRHNILIGADTYYERTTFHQFSEILQIDDIFNPVYPRIDVAMLRNEPRNSAQELRSQWYGIYFQDQLTILENIQLLVGGRYDWADTSSGRVSGDSVSLSAVKLETLRSEKFSPRFGVLYQAWPWLSLYGNYVESFGANNGRSASGQPFEPQTATQYEAGIKTEFLEGRLTSTLAFYHITKENLLTRDPNSSDPRDQQAIGEARSRGIELDMAGEITDQVSLIGNYAFTDARITKDFNGLEGNRLRNAPKHSGSFWVKYQPFERFSLGTGVQLVGSREGNTANTLHLPGYALWDAMAAYRFDVGKSRLTVQVNVNNILNKNYFIGDAFEIGALPGTPLTVLGSLRLEL